MTENCYFKTDQMSMADHSRALRNGDICFVTKSLYKYYHAVLCLETLAWFGEIVISRQSLSKFRKFCSSMLSRVSLGEPQVAGYFKVSVRTPVIVYLVTVLSLICQNVAA